MSFYFLDSSARSAWLAATTKTGQLEGLRDVWSGQAHLKHYSAGGTLLATVVHATPVVRTDTWELVPGAYVSQTVWASGVPTYCVWAVPGGADIVRADSTWDAADPTISDPGGRVRLDIGTTLRVQATASLPADAIPSWVPTTAWEWADVPGTVWDDYVPTLETPDASAKGGYLAQWDFSAPCYSKANHEVYMFGGGHAGTSLNAVSRYLLAQDTPEVEFFCAATPAATRTADISGPDYLTLSYYSDGKAYPPHSYGTNCYSDFADEMLSSISGLGQGADFSGAGWVNNEIAAITRAGTWRADGYYPAHPDTTNSGTWSSIRCMSEDGETLYYWNVNGSYSGDSTHLVALDLATRTHSTLGASAGISHYARVADNGLGQILALGSANSGGAWLAKFIDTATGAITSVTVSGDSIPSGKGIYGLAWCSDQGYWISVWMDAARVYDWVTASGTLIVATITKTGADTATASIRTIATGDGVPTHHRAYQGVFYDPTYGCLLYAAHPEYVVKAIKVGT